MSEQIEDLLHRRTDLSTFVVHFTRNSDGEPTSKDNLLSILKTGKLKARDVYGSPGRSTASSRLPRPEANGKDGVTDGAKLAGAEILRLTPFIEQMGPAKDGRRKEFWWEREWRHAGQFSLEPEQVVVAFVPESQHASFRRSLAEATKDWYDDLTFIDVNWGLERIVGALANVDAVDLGPFPR